MSIDQTHPSVGALSMHFDDVDSSHVSPVPSSEVLPNLMLVASNPVHSLSVHSLPEPLPVFPNLIDHSVPNGPDMHVSPPNLTTSAFLDPQSPLDPVAFPSTAAVASATFIPDFSSSFPVCSPGENGMPVKGPPPGHASSLSPPMTVPSSVIHGHSSSYGPGVTSSLQSALEPSVMPTSQLSVALPAMAVSTLNAPLTAEPLDDMDESLTSILDQVVHSASIAASLCRSEGKSSKVMTIVNELKGQVAHASIVSGLQNMTVDDVTPTLEYPQPPPLNISDPDLKGKRCATAAMGRRVKFKVEPQDDLPVSSSVNAYHTEISHIHALQSPPPSRSSSPPLFPFNPASSTANYSRPPPPLQRSAWSESGLPSRHSHSMSTGSINVSSSVRTVADTSFPQRTNIPQPAVSGRMSRSGSFAGNFVNPLHQFTFSKPPAATWSGGGGERDVAVSHQWRSSSAVPASRSRAPTESNPRDEEGGDDDDDDDSPGSGSHSQPSTSSDVPQEYRGEVDRIFFEYLNKICSNLDATDSKGEAIHQTLMAKKMQRLDESLDYRPFKFRIQAFTMAFLEELAKQGYPEEKIPMKKIRNYLWRHPYIQRYNDEGRKAKSKGNHIWNVEAKKAGNGIWEFRPFYRQLAGQFPGVAYCGLKWAWTPRVWDPQQNFQNVPVFYSSPNLPSWLCWKNDELSGTPPPNAQSCDITVIAKFILDGQEDQLSHTFHISVAPRSAMDPNWGRMSAPVDLPRRASEPALSRMMPARSPYQYPIVHHSNTIHHVGANVSAPSDAPARVVEVLQNVAQRVAEETEVSLASDHRDLAHLTKQKHAVEHGLAAYNQAINGPTAPDTHDLAVATQLVVAEAAQHAVGPQAAAAGITASPILAIQVASIESMTSLTQEALAAAVTTLQGSGSNDLQVIERTSNILATHSSRNVTPPYVSQTSGLSVSTFV